MSLPDLRQWIAEFNPDALLADGFDDAVIGIAERCGQSALVVYDADACIRILEERDGMTRDDALEFFSFNTLGSWVGENTPLYVWRFELVDEIH